MCIRDRSYGVIPAKGHAFSGTDGVEVVLGVVGPMARSVRDLSLAFDVTAGPEEASGFRLDLPPMRRERLEDFRVLILLDHPLCVVDASVSGPIRELADALSDLGADVREDSAGLPDLESAHKDYAKMLITTLSRGVPGSQPVSAHEWMDLLDRQMRLARQWRAAFRDIDVVLAPSLGTAAFAHVDEPDWGKRTLKINRRQTEFRKQLAWAGLATFPGLPATAAPLAMTGNGLPTGVQIIGDRHADRTTIGFARLLEETGLTLNGLESRTSRSP